MKRIIGYDENGNSNCACDDGNVYVNCGRNCECCDHIDLSAVNTVISYDYIETTSCPCSFYTVENNSGNLECEMESFGIKTRVLPIKITNHTINSRKPIIGDKWDCVDAKSCQEGNIKWDALHIVLAKEYTTPNFTPPLNSRYSTYNCYVPKTLLSQYDGKDNSIQENIYSEENLGVDIHNPEEIIGGNPLFTSIDQAQIWEMAKGAKTGKTSEYIDKEGKIKYFPGSYYPNKKTILSCHINDKNIFDSINFDSNIVLVDDTMQIKVSGEVIKLKITGENKPIVSISIKDSSNCDILKRKIKNIVIDKEYVLQQKIPVLQSGKTKETYTIEIIPSADTSYYYNGELISTGIIKYNIVQFKMPTITLSSNNPLTNTSVGLSGDVVVSAEANSQSFKTITATTTLARTSGTHYYHLTKKYLTFKDLYKNTSSIKKNIVNQTDADKLECKSNITIAESTSQRGDVKVGMTFSGEITKTKTVQKSVDLDEHLKEPCENRDLVDILTNKFELENTTDLFEGMRVVGINADNYEFITYIESVDCNKNITLTTHHIIVKETLLTFTHKEFGIVKSINKNNIELFECIKLPNNTELTFVKSKKENVQGKIFIDKNGTSSMNIKTVITNFIVGEDNMTLELDLAEFVSLKPPARDKRVTCGKNSSININFDFDSNSYSVLDIAATSTSVPSNGTLTTLKVPHPRFLTYTPNENFIGTDKFNFTLSDGVNTSDEKTIFITIK